MRGNRDKMLLALQVFMKKHGHCNVPTNSSDCPQLGRWVAAQRYKRRIGALCPEIASELEHMGFVWSPSDLAWDAMFQALVEFKAKHGHTDVPEQWPENTRLANWVQSQRHRHRKGKLAADRIHRLESIQFTWAIYKNDVEFDDEPKPEEQKDEIVVTPPSEKLYVIRNGTYVQYNGVGEMPSELAGYVRQRGEYPPYMPLPDRETAFFLGDSPLRQREIKWKGSGPLPDPVLSHVRLNGTLPRHD